MNYMITISKGNGKGFSYFTIYADSKKQASEAADRLFKMLCNTSLNEGYNRMSTLLSVIEI